MQQSREADVHVLTEEELGQWRRERGDRIVRHQGRLWVSNRGFCRLLHFTATIPARAASRPTPTCWAFHASLTEADSGLANAVSPVHLAEDLASFDERRLGSTERKHLRRCRQTIRLVRIDDPDLLLSQGWEIFSQNARRLRLYRHVTERAYLASVRALVSDRRMLLFGAMDGDRLLGYLETYAVEDTAYFPQVRLTDDALSRHVSGFLLFEAAQFYRRSGKVAQVSPGLPLLQRPGVSEFKTRWGMPIVEMPARFWAPAPSRALLSAVRPNSLYWATGIRPRAIPAGAPGAAGAA
jgi:hypothetical protein